MLSLVYAERPMQVLYAVCRYAECLGAQKSCTLHIIVLNLGSWLVVILSVCLYIETCPCPNNLPLIFWPVVVWPIDF
jgi:hypothetical protein